MTVVNTNVAALASATSMMKNTKDMESAMAKLSSGKGNLIRQAHFMRQLGVDTSKQIDRQLLNKALDESIETTTQQQAQ